MPKKLHRLRTTTAIKRLAACAVCLGLIVPELTANPREESFPTIPADSVDKYTVTVVDERIESFDIPQMHASGRNLTFKMDTVDGHSVAKTPAGASLVLQHYANPQLKVTLNSFKAGDFDYELNMETLQAYLEGIGSAMREEQNFRVLEEPSLSTGPARFRFLGQRAIPMRYRFEKDGMDLTRAENWFVVDDTIHVIAVEGPSRAFDRYFESIRVPFNSSVALSN